MELQTVKIDKNTYDKAKEYCQKKGLKLQYFLSEAIEKRLKNK